MQLLTPNGITCSINGVDVSAHLINAGGSFSSISENGLCIITGELELATRAGTTEFNLLSFRLGQPVIIRRNGVRVAVLGHLFIDSIQINESETTLSIKLTCALGLAGGFGLAKAVLCLNPEQTLPAANAISTLLSPLGIQSSVSNVPGAVRDVVIASKNESIVSLAGQIAFAKGHFLFQDRDGVVRARKFQRYNSIGTYNRENQAYRYDQNAELELPASYFEVSTADLEVNEQENPFTRQTVTSESVTTYTKVIDWEDREVETEDEYLIYDLDILPEDLWGGTFGQTVGDRTQVLETYENNRIVKEDCVVDDKGRLLTRSTEKESARGIHMESALRSRQAYNVENGLAPNDGYSVGAIGVYYQSEESWTYDYTEVGAEPTKVNTFVPSSSSGVPTTSISTSGKIVYTNVEREAIGTHTPWAGRPDFGRSASTSTIVVNINILREIRKTEIVWERRADKRTWDRTTRIYESAWLRDPDGITAMIGNSSIDLGTVLNSAYIVRLTSVEVEENSAPPEPTRFPVRYTIEQRPKLFFRNQPSLNGLTRTKSVSVPPNLYNNDSREIVDLTNYISQLAWWRYYSFITALDGDDVPSSVLPLDEMQVTYGSRVDRVVIDAPSLFIRKNEYMFGCSSMLVSRSGVQVLESNDYAGVDTEAGEYDVPVVFNLVDPNDNYLISS